MMPIVEPGASARHCASVGSSATFAVCAARKASSRLGECGVRQGQHGGGKQRGVDRARLADGQRSDRNAGRHLDDGKQRILPGQGLRFDRHAENRQRGQRRGHARQMRGTPGARDDDLEARRLCAPGEIVEPFGRAVGGDDALVMRHAERIERLGGMAHRRPVGLAAHDDRDVGALVDQSLSPAAERPRNSGIPGAPQGAPSRLGTRIRR